MLNYFENKLSLDVLSGIVHCMLNLKVIFFYFLCYSFNSVIAQDTIVYKNKKFEQVKIVEVGLEVIKYKRFNNIEGPIYSISKGEVSWLKYANGTIDRITQNADESPNNFLEDKIELRGFAYLYKGQLYDVKDLKSLIKSHRALSNNYAKLLECADDLYLCDKRINRSAPSMKLMGFLSPPAFLAVGVFLGFAFDDYDITLGTGISGLAFGVALEISGFRVTAKYKKKQLVKQKEFVDLFNQSS